MNRHLQEELDTDMPKYVKVMIVGTIIAWYHGNIQIYISCALYGENVNTGEVGHVSVTEIIGFQNRAWQMEHLIPGIPDGKQ